MVPRAPPDLSTFPDRIRLHGEAEAFVEHIIDTHVQTKANLDASVTKYKATKDSHRRRLVFEVGDLVWAVLTRDRMPAHAYNKLKSKKISPLEVLERINEMHIASACHLVLQRLMSLTSNTYPAIFHLICLLIRGRILFIPGNLMQQHLRRSMATFLFLIRILLAN
ncbi:hypothetical protein Bca52824_016383 [Brassica carinata]|uniref:Uncharacterized protein n=1 Tax=Brassica carinata TaxID=52824 RepID=A0A8X8B5C2_BRACI|nr:hypothetical protein Bca52824_016383 [Brassica carinata]